MKTSNRLTTLQLPALLKQPGRHRDGDGLILLVRENGAAFWVCATCSAARPASSASGPCAWSTWPRHGQGRGRPGRRLLDKRDPVEIKHAAVAGAAPRAAQDADHLRAGVREFLATDAVERLRNDKHRKQWRSTLERSLSGARRPAAASPSTRRILLQGAAADHGGDAGDRDHGCAAGSSGCSLGRCPTACSRRHEPRGARRLLNDLCRPSRRSKHHEAMPYARAAGFMARLRERDSVSARALELTILTATRTSETIGATWAEIDFDVGVVDDPRRAHEGKKPHRVPLTERAVELLRAMPRQGEFVFVNGGGKPLSNMALLELLKGMAPGVTTHGFRLELLRLGARSHGLCAGRDRARARARRREQGCGRLPARRCARQAPAAHGRVVPIPGGARRRRRERRGLARA